MDICFPSENVLNMFGLVESKGAKDHRLNDY